MIIKVILMELKNLIMDIFSNFSDLMHHWRLLCTARKLSSQLHPYFQKVQRVRKTTSRHVSNTTGDEVVVKRLVPFRRHSDLKERLRAKDQTKIDPNEIEYFIWVKIKFSP